MVQAPLLTACNPPNADFLGEPEIPMREWLNQLANRIIAGDRIKREEALALTQNEGQENIFLLGEAADRVRQACCGNTVNLCNIVNIKSGNCSENRAFCVQSAHHPGQESPIYGITPKQEILAQAKAAEAAGTRRFCVKSFLSI